MTHKDIYTKFMIEYDKALITSSYPSLTLYEIATILDKAYLALVALKLTGNNPRQTIFEGDTKAIEDVRPLIVTHGKNTTRYVDSNEYGVSNAVYIDLSAIDDDDKLLYFIQASLKYTDNKFRIVQLISHENAKKFFRTATNRPWIKNSVAYIEGDRIIFLYDDYPNAEPKAASITYLKVPAKFTDDKDISRSSVEFELSDTMAEELINLAIITAAENVESPRLASKIQTRPLES